MVGILEDKDRIFTNLYGLHDWRLEAAKRRGTWNGTADMLAQTPEWICDQIKNSGPARPRRRRLRHRPEVDLHAQGGGRAAALPGGQRRRVRAGHLQGPRDHAPRSAPADRGLPDRLPRHAGARLLHLHPRRDTCASASTCEAAIAEAYEARLIGKDNSPRLGLRHPRRPRRRRLHLRRRDGAAGEPGGQEGPAAAEAAVPGRRRPLWLPDHGQQRRDRSPWSATILRRGADWFAGFGAAEQHRHQAVSRLRPRRTSRAWSKR